MGNLSKKFLGFLALLITVNALIYLGFALIMWNLHPGMWDGFMRFMMTSLMAVADVIVMALYLDLFTDEELSADLDELLSLPPAEGAEQRIRVRNILQDFYRRGEYELEQAEEDIMRLFQQQPTAEGAEQLADLKQYMTNLLYYVADPANVPADQLDHWVEEMVNGIDEYFKSKQPTAEGAEEILTKHLGSLMPLKYGVKYNKMIDAMQDFATLHAQRIAEKMVEERLMEELIGYDKFLSNTYWGISHIIKRDEAVDEYLKSRER